MEWARLTLGLIRFVSFGREKIHVFDGSGFEVLHGASVTTSSTRCCGTHIVIIAHTQIGLHKLKPQVLCHLGKETSTHQISCHDSLFTSTYMH